MKTPVDGIFFQDLGIELDFPERDGTVATLYFSVTVKHFGEDVGGNTKLYWLPGIACKGNDKNVVLAEDSSLQIAVLFKYLADSALVQHSLKVYFRNIFLIVLVFN